MIIRLKNSMRDENYSFPESIVCYDVDMKGKNADKLALYCGEKNIPYQLKGADTEKMKLSFVSELKNGEEKLFELREGKSSFENTAHTDGNIITAQNKYIKVTVSDSTDCLFEITNGTVHGKSVLSCKVRDKKAELLENGAVYAKIKITAILENNEEYIQFLTLDSCCEYVILDEEINTNGADMKIVWDNVKPIKRVTQCGETEGRKENYFGADEYTDGEGKIPQRLLPHDQTNGFANSIYCAFIDNAYAYGMFMGDINEWNDGSYSIEGNNYINAVEAYCKYDVSGCCAYFKYPINRGTRQTAITIYAAEKEYASRFSSYIRELHFFYTKLPLNLFKDWVLEWDCDKNKFPIYFKKEMIDENQKYDYGTWEKGIPDSAWMLDYIKQNKIYKKPWLIGPVWTRAYTTWVPVFDLRAREMTDDEFNEYKKILVFGAYYCNNENIMPIETTLAGHPNFLIDTQDVVGMCAALFPEHPMAKKWKERYEKCVALTFKFHIRPEVKSWKALGGRPTESQGTYALGCLNHMMEASFMLEKVYKDNPMLCENCEKLSNWILNIVTSPLNGKRVLPYTGAHAGNHYLNPYYLNYHVRMLGYLMMEYNPELGEGLLNICPSKPIYGHETATYNGRDIWDFVVENNEFYNNCGTMPELSSSKFTGYGYNLRANVNLDDEMFVLLQQIDDGQNYRWGRAAQGGCGTIHYYADGKRYTGNRKEDIGDDNFTDAQVGCNFCVLEEQTYKAIGRNELVNPLIDVGFLKYARIDSGDYSKREYKYRSVMMIDNRYIVIYDAVRDIRTEGKFSWFNYTDEDMPYIYQLKPGAVPVYKNAPEYTLDDKPRAKAIQNDKEVRGVSYNGYGDFLTVVTHKGDIKAKVSDFGAVVCEKEYIFNSNKVSEYSEAGIEFFGKVGFARRTQSGFEMCIIDAYKIGVDSVVMELCTKGAVSLTLKNGVYYGKADTRVSVRISGISDIEKMHLYCNGEEKVITEEKGKLCFEVPEGNFEITSKEPMPEKIRDIKIIEQPGGIQIKFEKINNAVGYEAAISEDNIDFNVLSIKDNCLFIKTRDKKLYIKIRAVNDFQKGEWSNVSAVYFTGKIPKAVKGFNIKAQKDGIYFSWGRKYGVSQYRLYKCMHDNTSICIYEGSENKYFQKDSSECEYFVTCVNGYGESQASVVKNTYKNGPAYSDPMPDVKYLRDTIVNLHGYGGFDYEYNNNRRILEYPD